MAGDDIPMEMLEARIDARGPCWLWTGHIAKDGYPKLGRKRRTFMAHRLVYERLVGEIPKGLTLDHLCRVRHCVNPDHLEVTTIRTNALRGFSPPALNARKAKCIRGHSLADAIIRRNGDRLCRTCEQARWRRKREEQRAMT